MTILRPSHRVVRVLAAGLLVAVVTLVASTARAQRQVDGIAAIVDGEVISIGQVRRAALQRRSAELGDVVRACRAEAPGTGDASAADSLDAPGEGDLTGPELRAALECLIDSTLVFREVRRFPQIDVTDEEIGQQIEALEESAGSAAALDSQLRELHLTREELRTDLLRQLLVASYVDSRFRAVVEISDSAAREAWETELAPGMRDRGLVPPAFEDVEQELVVPLLREREVNRLVESWIADLRQRATIERRYP